MFSVRASKTSCVHTVFNYPARLFSSPWIQISYYNHSKASLCKFNGTGPPDSGRPASYEC